MKFYMREHGAMLTRHFAKIVVVACIMMGFLPSLSTAKQVPFNGCETPYLVYYINGVRTDFVEAALNLEDLKLSAPRVAGSQQEILYLLAFNETNGAVFDTVQSAQQKLQQYTSFLSIGDAFSIFFLDTIANSDIIAGLPFGIGDQLRKDAAVFSQQLEQDGIRNYVASAPDLASVYNTIKNTVRLPLVLLGHSQGTLFANQVYQLLLNDGYTPSSLTTLGVAAVTTTMLGSVTDQQQYVTSSNDLLVAFVRNIDPLTLSANTSGPLPDVNDPLAHGFATTYLRDPGLRSRVVTALSSAIGGLSTSCEPPPVEITVQGTQPGWTVSPLIQMSGLVQASRTLFPSQGTVGNTCGSETGTPFYSQSVSIDPSAEFFGAPIDNGAPYLLGPPNRRPCSSFVSFKYLPDPQAPGDITKRKPRFWINATARGQRFTSNGENIVITSFEYQLRLDSGDPFNNNQGYRCDVGLVLTTGGNWIRQWSPSSCVPRFVLS